MSVTLNFYCMSTIFFVLFFCRAAKEKARAKEQQKKVAKVKLPNALAVIA